MIMTDTAVYRPGGERCHFYSADGEPVWELPNKSKGGMRPVTLADAKKLDLLPSITTVIQGGRPTPFGLQRYKMEQFGQHLLTTPRLVDESDEAFLGRVNDDYQDAMEEAPDLGTAIHGAIADFLRSGKQCKSGLEVIFAKIRAWIERYVDSFKLIERPLADPEAGYAGTPDALLCMRCGAYWLADWKTQAIQKKPRVYDEWVIQLAAQRQLLRRHDIEVNAVANVIIPTTDYQIVEEYCWSPDEITWGEQAFRLALDSYRHNNRFPLKKAA